MSGAMCCALCAIHLPPGPADVLEVVCGGGLGMVPTWCASVPVLCLHVSAAVRMHVLFLVGSVFCYRHHEGVCSTAEKSTRSLGMGYVCCSRSACHE